MNETSRNNNWAFYCAGCERFMDQPEFPSNQNSRNYCVSCAKKKGMRLYDEHMRKKEISYDRQTIWLKAAVRCPQCNKYFNHIWDADFGEKQTLHIATCPSGGIYSVKIICPYCDYEEEL